MSADLRVVHMPGRMGGEATIGDTRIDCRTIAGRVWAGETVAGLADDFGITRDQVRLACWWMVEHCLPLYVKWEWEAKDAWRAWAKRWETLARNGDGDRAGDPTRKARARTREGGAMSAERGSYAGAPLDQEDDVCDMCGSSCDWPSGCPGLPLPPLTWRSA